MDFSNPFPLPDQPGALDEDWPVRLAEQVFTADRLTLRETDFSRMLDLLPIGLVVHRHDAIVWANPAAARILGADQVAELLGSPVTGRVDSTSRRAMADAAGQGTPFQPESADAGVVEERLIRMNGERFLAEVFALPTFFADAPASLVCFNDISLRRAREEEVRLATSVYDHTSEGMLVTDARGTILAVNPAFERMSGYRRDELLGQKPGILLVERHAPGFYQRIWRSLLETGRWSGEVGNRRRDGTPYVERLTINTVYDDNNRVLRYVALFSDITAEKSREAIIWKQAHYDWLTGLPNRRQFHDWLEQEFRQSRRSGRALTLMFVDLDRFKEINDTLGHAKGDRLLQEAARRIRASVRDSDFVARLGGDEFTVVFPGLVDSCQIQRVASQLLEQLRKPFDLGDGDTGYASASIGVACHPRDAGDPDTLMRHADQAMYAAKAAGRNRMSLFDFSMQQQARERLELGNDLRHALERGEMSLVYQPIVNLRDGSTAKLEALLRWEHASRGSISPTDFIPLAEELGIIHELGNWVVDQVLELQNSWAGNTGLPQVSINCSPLQFEHDVDVKPWLQNALGQPVVIEITEGLLLKASEPVRRQLEQLRKSGVELALDDFGTGYSALSYLKQFDIHYLKLDKSFMSGIFDHERDRLLVEGLIALAHNLGIRTIAEGIETEAQHDLVAGWGCDYAQGYWYAKPLAREALDDFLMAGTG